MLFILTGTEKFAKLFDISHVIIASIVSEIRPIARITLPPLLSILKKYCIIFITPVFYRMISISGNVYRLSWGNDHNYYLRRIELQNLGYSSIDCI